MSLPLALWAQQPSSQPDWARDLGLWVQVDSHAPHAADARAVLRALSTAPLEQFLNDDMALHVNRCRAGRAAQPGTVERQYSTCHCRIVRRGAIPTECTPRVMGTVATRFRLNTQARTVPLSVTYRSELSTLVIIPRSQRRVSGMANARARVVQDCAGRHLQVLAPRLTAGATVPQSFLQQLRGYLDNVTIAPTLEDLGLAEPRAGAAHIASVCDVSRPNRPAYSVVNLDTRQNAVEYNGNTAGLVDAGYVNVSCLPEAARPARSRAQAADTMTAGSNISAEELARRNAYCRQMHDEFIILREILTYCNRMYPDGISQDSPQCTRARTRLMQNTSNMLGPNQDVPFSDYMNSRISYIEHCNNQPIQNEEERLTLVLRLAAMQFFNENSPNASEQLRLAQRALIDWCINNMCECRSSPDILNAANGDFWPPGENTNEGMLDDLAAAEQALNARYRGRESALVQECPGTFSPAQMRSIRESNRERMNNEQPHTFGPTARANDEESDDNDGFCYDCYGTTGSSTNSDIDERGI